MFAMWFFISLWLQLVLGLNAIYTGLTFLPQTIAVAIAAILSGKLSPTYGPRNFLILGCLLMSAGLIWLSRVQPDDSYATGVCGGGIVATLGMGMSFTAINMLATSGVERKNAGLASGLVNCSR